MADWQDDVTKGAEFIKGYVDFILKERSQLYGTIVHLMIEFGTNKMEMPPRSDMMIYGSDYYILFSKHDDGKYYVELKEQIDRENNEILD